MCSTKKYYCACVAPEYLGNRGHCAIKAVINNLDNINVEASAEHN